MSEALTITESDRLAELEDTIERGLETFVEVGNALEEIRESKLYRETDKTFAAYVKARWGFTASRARQLIAAAKTATVVTVSNESQARELGGLDQGAIKRIWKEAQKIAEANESEVTAATIKEARRLSMWDFARSESGFRMRYSPPGNWSGPPKAVPRERVGAALDVHDRIKSESDAIRIAAGLEPLPEGGTVTAWRQQANGNGASPMPSLTKILADLRRIREATACTEIDEAIEALERMAAA